MKKVFLALTLLLAAPAWATVSTTNTSLALYGNGSATAFPVTFPFISTTDLLVTVDGASQSLGSQYTVSKTSAMGSSTGTVTFTTAPANGAAIVITRNTPLTQPLSLINQGVLSPTAMETAYDRSVLGTQQVNDRVAKEEAARAAADTAADAKWTANVAALSGTSHAQSDLSSVLALGSTTPRTLTARFADVANVLDYGAYNDGTHTAETTTAFSLALAASSKVIVPAGSYVINQNMVIPVGTHFQGSPGLTTIRTATGVTTAFEVHSKTDFDGIVLDGTSTPTATGVLVTNSAANTSNNVVRNSVIQNFGSGYGLVIKRAVHSTYENLYIYANGNNVWIPGEYVSGDGQYPTTQTFRSVRMSNGVGSNTLIFNVDTILFHDCIWESSMNDAGFIINVTQPSGYIVDGVVIEGGWFEGNYHNGDESKYQMVVYGAGVGSTARVTVRNTFFSAQANGTSRGSINFSSNAFGFVLDNVDTPDFANPQVTPNVLAHEDPYPIIVGNGSFGTWLNNTFRTYARTVHTDGTSHIFRPFMSKDFGLPSYSNNAAAIAGGLPVGDLYRNGDVVQIVH